MRVRARFESRDRLMRRLRRIVPEAEREMARAQREAAEELADVIANRARRRTGELADSIVAAPLASRPQGTAPVGIRQTRDPNAWGIFGLYIWRFVEFGTRAMRAFPFVFPTYRAMRRRIRRTIAAAMNKAVRAAMKGR